MPHQIRQIKFGLFSPEFVKNMAKVRVVTSELYDADGYPVEGGVMDPRLGVIDPGLHCRTCGGGIGDCPGHFGYLELARPVVNVLYTKTVYQLLKFTCRKCNKVMFEEDRPTAMEETIAQPGTCPHCKAKQKKVQFVKPYTYYEGKDELTAMTIRERFEKLSDKDLKRIGFIGGRPEWLVLTLFPVPPVTMRPSITLEGGERSEDDLTHKLVDIVRINQSLKENIDIGAPQFIISDLWELVQYHVSTYFDNELTGAPLARHRSGRALKGIIQRLKAKEGRIRGNLLGKRVNFSARTVISPDPRISINEVGVPLAVASELTVPVTVTALNLKEVKEIVSSGKVNYVLRPDGRRIKVMAENREELLANLGPEWSADRQLQDGDVVLFNRQPSLHRVSMMAHRVKLMDSRTFRLNPSVCFPYNADFDGDEMNLHVPQSEEARAEALLLMDVQNNLISPKFGGPVVGLDLDQISGIALLTRKKTILSREQAAQLLAAAGLDVALPETPAESTRPSGGGGVSRQAGGEVTGKQLFSLLLPAKLNATYESHFAAKLELPRPQKEALDGVVVIKDGQLLSGVIDKASVGAEKGKLIMKIKTLAGGQAAREFIDTAGRLGIAYLMLRGFSIGISDLDLPPEAHRQVAALIEASQQEALGLIEKHAAGELPGLPGLTSLASLEAQIMNALANGVSKVSEVVGEHVKGNDLMSMIDSGAKGSLINTTQMAAVVGQETILGKRIKRGYRKRTLSHFTPGDLSPGSHGFVARGFKQGLTPFELFWNIMNGREGLMDKSLRTRKSGYLQRRLVNALQDLKVSYDLSVRNAAGGIVQFIAGEDGVDPTKSAWGKVAWQEAASEVSVKRPAK